MKNFLIILLSLMALASCQNNHKCLIEGTVGNSDLNGKRIFLVPVFHEDSLGVDSVVIQNNRFQFERNEEFLADIDLADSAPNVALAIHDKLIDLVSYDKEAASSLDKDLAHTAYGALVANSRGDANSAVCDGYSYAYEYLLQKAGIRSTIIAGLAGDTEESAGPHSWNLVELSGEWYEVDSTWNDISAEEALNSEEEYSEIAEEAMRNEWYTDRLRHFLFNVTTEQISSFEPGKYYRYTNDRGWVSFLSDSVHIRHTQEDSSSTGDYMTPLAPTAEGTRFSYENLKDGNEDGE